MCLSLLGGTRNRDGEDESVEHSAADLSPDRQEAALDDIARRLQMECVEEGSGAIEPSPEAEEASNALTIQPDDEDGNEDDDT